MANKLPEMPAEMRKKLEEMSKPTFASTLLSFPVLFLTFITIPFGFLGGALWAGWMMGIHHFKEFAARRAMEGLARMLKQKAGK